MRVFSKNENGYLLVSLTVVLLVIVAVLSTYSFVSQRDARFRSNYAAGQRLADIAVMAHNYAQMAHFENGMTLDNVELYNAANINPPDNLAFAPINGTQFTVSVIGFDSSPINPTAVLPAPSAYIHLKVRTPAGIIRAPSDRIAFLSGANNHGLNRLGIVGNVDATDLCDTGNASWVRWGAESSACLDANQANAIFTDVQPGDIIIPAWETAMNRTDEQAMFRYPQPGRGDVTSMRTGLDMSGNMITGADQTFTDNINQGATTLADSANATIGTVGNTGNALVVREGAAGQETTADMKAGMVIGTAGTPANMNVMNRDPSAPAMTLDNNVAVNIQQDFNVAGDVTGLGALNATVTDPSAIVAVNQVGDASEAIQVQFANLSSSAPLKVLSVDTVDPSSNITTLGVNPAASSATRLNVVNLFDASAGEIKPTPGNVTDVYAFQMTAIPDISNGVDIMHYQNPTLDWTVGAIQQSGTTLGKKLNVQRLRIDQDCFGKGCPDDAKGPPGGGI